MSKKLYVCHNPACTLGSIHDPGRFAGGMTAQGKHLLTGAPPESLKEGDDYGDGICPNCGQKAELFDQQKEKEAALKDAKEAYEAQVAAIKAEA